MILKQQLDVKRPTAFKSVIDVYESQGRIIARRMPTRCNQPNTQAQLAVRNAYREMLALRTSANAYTKSLWSNAILPPGKTWDDFYRSNCLKAHWLWDGWSQPFDNWNTSAGFCHVVDYDQSPPVTLYGFCNAYIRAFDYVADLPPHMGCLDQGFQLPTWEQDGVVCFKGRKILPHYKLMTPSPFCACREVMGMMPGFGYFAPPGTGEGGIYFDLSATYRRSWYTQDSSCYWLPPSVFDDPVIQGCIIQNLVYWWSI